MYVRADSLAQGMAVTSGRQTLSQAVAGALLDRFRAGEFRVGDRLATEKGLMEQFGVGRNVAREAVQVLVAMRLVDVRPGRGAVVVAVDPSGSVDPGAIAALLFDETVDDLYEFRSVIEVALAERAALRASDADLHDVRREFDRFREACEPGGSLVEADIAFHNAIARASHNAIYVRALDTLQEVLAQARRLTVDIGWVRERTLIDHEQITKALVARDAAGAAEAMRRHMELAVAAVAAAREQRAATP
jgi:GntR family transcriptional repressor for pyruvate dehydrogenase complex